MSLLDQTISRSSWKLTLYKLMHRIFRILRENNPSLGLGKKVTLPPPLVFREGSKKTIFANIYDMSVRLHRPLDHFKDYLFAELGTNGSVDGSNRLTLKGRFQQKQLENVVRRYIHEYVTCKTCKSPDTLLAKENRVWFITCESCGSKRSVSAIKTGFQAQTSVCLILNDILLTHASGDELRLNSSGTTDRSQYLSR
jgi:translation initiation factor 2 subunit 2